MFVEFQKQITERGWFIFHEVISSELIERMKFDLEKCYVRCRKIQIENGLKNTEYTVHHLIGQESAFMDCLVQYEKLNPYFEWYFEGKYILNSIGGNILSKDTSYANNIHRDIRSFSCSLPLMLNTLLFLDDFTPENGATWLMDGGHLYKGKPSDDEFNKYAFQITGKSGSVAVWNSNLWHRAGVNTTDKPRRSVTPELTKPFIKQGYDYPRVLGYEYGNACSPWLRQVLGYDSRIPANLSEWYRKPEDRFYKGDQG